MFIRIFMRFILFASVLFSFSLMGAEFQTVYLAAPQEKLREFAVAINDQGSVLLAGKGSDLRENCASRDVVLATFSSPIFSSKRLLKYMGIDKDNRSAYVIHRPKNDLEPFIYWWNPELGFQPIANLSFTDHLLLLPKINNSHQVAAVGWRHGFSSRAALVVGSTHDGVLWEFPPVDQWTFPGLQLQKAQPFKGKGFVDARDVKLEFCLLDMNNKGCLLLRMCTAQQRMKPMFWNGTAMVYLEGIKDVYKINNSNRCLCRERFSHWMSIRHLEDGSSREIFKWAGTVVTGFNDREEIVGMQVTSKEGLRRRGFYWSEQSDWRDLDFFPIAINQHGDVLGVKIEEELTLEDFTTISHVIKGDYIRYQDQHFWDCWMALEKKWLIWNPVNGSCEIAVGHGDRIVFLHDLNNQGEIVGEVMSEDGHFYPVLLKSSFFLKEEQGF